MVRRARILAIFVLILILNISLLSSYELPIIKLQTEGEKQQSSFFSFILNLFSDSGKEKPSIKLLTSIVNKKNSSISSESIYAVRDINGNSESEFKKKTITGSFINSIVKTFSLQKSNDDSIEDEIIKRNEKEYIVRDGEEYLFSSELKAQLYIDFNPLLPQEVCENEPLIITVVGRSEYLPDSVDVINCMYNEDIDFVYTVKIMESDTLNDDEVFWGTQSVSIPCSCLSNSDDCEFNFEKTLNYVYLAPYIEDDSGDYGEFYVKIYDGVDDQITKISSPTYSVYGYVNGECACAIGACCDLAGGRPYDFKSYNSQPTSYTDYYFCDGVNSPTTINYVMSHDYYCSGSSQIAQERDIIIDACGICEGCYDDYPSVCQPHPLTAVCGVTDCDLYDTTCRNYHDVDRYCNGVGGCNVGTCNSYINAPYGTTCGTNQICDGNGNCVGNCECTSGDCCDGCYYMSSGYVCNSEYEIDFGCPNGEGTDNPGDDVYRRIKQMFCSGESELCDGTISGWSSWNIYDSCSDDEYCTDNDPSCNFCGYHTYYACYDGDVYWYDLCNNLEGKKEECVNRPCLNGECVSSSIECHNASECGEDGFISDEYCSTGDLYRDYRHYICVNPGTQSSYCYEQDTSQLVEDCGEFICFERICAGENYLIDLFSGWNEIGFSVLPPNRSTQNVFSSVEGMYENIWSYIDGEWLSYSPDVLPEMNTLLKINRDIPISIEMNQDAELSFIYYPGNLSEFYDSCEVTCKRLDKYTYCYLNQSFIVEGESFIGSCYSIAQNYPEIGYKCDQFYLIC